MKRLLIDGDPGIRKDDVIEYDDREMVCFGVTRNGDYHGPQRVQLWCVIGTEAEREDFETRNFVPHFLETESIDAESVSVVST